MDRLYQMNRSPWPTLELAARRLEKADGRRLLLYRVQVCVDAVSPSLSRSAAASQQGAGCGGSHAGRSPHG